ncbi:MAG TPA: hypothetical protein PLM37_06185, partial [Elusimicrobiota bacterium]|nr:hypothetical protein [Elusimicrobiota bacterium]
HVITRWLAERGYNIVGDPSIRTQRGIVLDTFRLSHLDGSPLSTAEEESVAIELQKFLDRPEIGENDFGNGSLPRTPSGPTGSPGWLAGLTLRDVYHSLGLFFPPFHHMAEAVSPGVVGFPILPGGDKGAGASVTPEAAATSLEPPIRPAEMTYDMTPEKRDHLAATLDNMRALVTGRRAPAVKRLRKYTDDDYTFSHVYELLMSVSMNGTAEDRRTAIQLLDILILPRKTYSSLDYDLICFYQATRAELLVQEGKIADALKSMKAHAELFDKYNASSDMVPATRLDMARFGAVKWARLASPLYDLQDFDNCRLAIETAGRYLNQAGVDEEARLTDPFNWVMSTRHLLEGMMLIRRGDAVTASGKRSAQERRRLLEAALVHYQRSESFLPEEPFGLIQRAGALYRLDRNGEARRVLSRALELGPDFGVAHALRGQFLLDAASRAAARRSGRARDLLVQALAAFKTAAAAPQQADVSPLRLRLIEMETYLRLARLAVSDADRQEWEGKAQGQLATGITAYFQKAVNDGTLIEPFLHEWIVYGEERGNPTPGLDLLLGQKDNQRGQEFMKAAAHAVRTSSRSLEKWTEALLAKALDPADRRGRAAAVRMIGYLGEQSVLRTLVRRALAAGDADLLPEAVEALGEGASALPVPLLLTLSGRSEIQRKPRARRVVDDALGLQRAAFESGLIELTNEDVTAPAAVNARERQDQRRWAASLLGRLDDKRQEAVELKINLGRVINGESGESRLNRFAAGLAAFVARLDAAEEAVVHQKVYNALVPYQGTINTIVFRRDGDRLNALEKRFDALVADFAAQSPNPMDVESVRALVDGVRSDLARAREFLNYPLETWQIRVHALLDRYNNTTEENFPEPVLWDQELAAIQSVAAELRADLEKSPFPDMMERHAEMEVEALGLIEDHLAEERREYRETLGGRWPLLETIYRRIGGLGGLVLLPVTLE